jgi:hypothetical protein
MSNGLPLTDGDARQDAARAKRAWPYGSRGAGAPVAIPRTGSRSLFARDKGAREQGIGAQLISASNSPSSDALTTYQEGHRCCANSALT